MRYVWHRGEWWEVNPEYRPKPRIAIVSDHQEPLLHPVTGQIYDSKSRFRAATRDSGCVELGNDAPTVSKRPEIDKKALREDIYRSIAELEAGRPAPVSQMSQGIVRRYDA